ncbi:MAG: DNA translocase FtsK [Gemmatimonadota bacterium]|nr:DNA translocase FtsK [Gemmatimonadota bacterium]
MLSQKQQKDIAAVGLLGLGLFLLAALVPVTMPGLGGVEFPEGNVMGVVGAVVRGVLTGIVGIAAFFVPGLLILAGLRARESLSVTWTRRLSILLGGLLLIVPIGLGVLGQDGETVGRWGELAGPALVTALGVPGGVLLVVLLLVALSVGTIGWNPIASLVGGVAQGTGFIARAARALFSMGERLKARWDQRSKDRLERTPPMELLKGDEVSDPDSEGVGDDVEGEEHGEPFEGDLESAGRAGEGGGDEERDGGDVWDGIDEGDRDDDPFAEGDVSDTGLPPMEFMSAADDEHRHDMERELDALGEVLIEKLRTFNVECTLGGRTTGPVVTQYEVIPAPGVKVNKIASLDADLALAMKAKSIRIVAPVPGRGAVGVEIPNPEPEVVRLRDILDSPTYQASRAQLPLALGKDLNGRPYVADLRDMPHILIAGATGSGKSVCLNTIITSLVYRHTPKTLRLLMVDPKMVELSTYRLLPHLRHKVVTDPQDAAGLLKWAVLEMDRRYNLLNANGVRSIGEFNERVEEGATLRRFEPKGADDDSDRGIYDEGVLPYVVVVVDELADLMMTVQSAVERPLTFLAQKGRAIGIHLIVATQRPSVNVITGLIKANFPSRIAFRVASKTDSRTILDQNGADSLLGNGDMLFLPPSTSEPVRIQGAYISTAETDRMMAWYRDQIEIRNKALDEVEAAKESDILEQMRAFEHEAEMAVGAEDAGDWDDLFRAAGEVCVQNQQGSTSLLQRKLKVGYGRAARIVDQLHDAGILGPSEGSKAREVLVGLDELETICGHRGL